MAGGLLVALTVAIIPIGIVMGLLASAIGMKTDIDRLVAFGWGAALGPIGLVVVAVVALRQHRSGDDVTSSTASPAPFPGAPF